MEDPAFPERYPHRYMPFTCEVCRECWFDKLAGRCIYGGPYAGYVHVKEPTAAHRPCATPNEGEMCSIDEPFSKTPKHSSTTPTN